MQRPVAVLVALGAVLLAAGCGSGGTPPVIPEPAPPQAAELAWVERSPETGSGLVFRVRRFAVTRTGWESDVEIENRTDIAWSLGENPVAVEQSFGIMLFATGDMGELEQRNQNAELPGLRAARRFVPELPARLGPGEAGAGRSPPRARSPPAAGSGSRSARSSRPAILRTTCRASSSGSRTTRTTYGRGPDVRGP